MGCWVNSKGEPIEEDEPGASQCRPDVAFLDIDFKISIECRDRESTRWSHFPDDTQSARLGWAVASTVRRAAPLCEIVMYTGKEDVERGLGEACIEVDCDGERIPPFIRVKQKVTGFDKIFEVVQEEQRRLAKTSIREGRFDLNAFELFITHFSVLRSHEYYDKLVHESWPDFYEERSSWIQGDRLRDWVYKVFWGFLSLFPQEFNAIADFQVGDTTVKRWSAIQSVLESAASVDRNISLVKTFKQLRLPNSGASVFLTPAAALKHNHIWNYDGTGLTCQEDRPLASFDNSNRPDYEQISNQERCFNQWYATAMEVDPSLRQRITESGLQPFDWFRSLGQPRNRFLDEWESDFKFWVLPLANLNWGEMEVQVGHLPEGRYLTDWKGLFLGASSAFGAFVARCRDEGAEKLTFTGSSTDDSAELILSVVPKGGKHIGSLQGFQGARSEQGLFGWGRSWIVSSLPPQEMADNLGSTTHEERITTVRHELWPPSDCPSVIRLVSAAAPIFELHWQMKDYLAQRTLN